MGARRSGSRRAVASGSDEGWGAVAGGYVGQGRSWEVVGKVGQVPGGAVAEEAGDKGGVHGMAGALGYDAALDAAAGEGEVADEVEDLVADEFVGEAQGTVLDAGAGDDDGAVVGDAADEAHVAELLLVLLEAEGAGGGDLLGVGLGGEVADEGVGADGLGKIDGVVDAVAVAGVDADELVAVVDLDGLEDAEVLAAAALLLEADGLEGLDVGQGAAVEDGELEVVEFDDDVVHAVADEGGEKVLGGGDEHTLAHEAGGVADLGDVAAGGGNFKVVEVGAAEDDAGASRGGHEAHGHGCAAVEADAGERGGVADCVFEVALVDHSMPVRRRLLAFAALLLQSGYISRNENIAYRAAAKLQCGK